MSVEFVDTNVLIYAHDSDSGTRHGTALKLMTKLAENGTGAISTQVLMEFYSIATRKLGMQSQDAEASIEDLADWILHRPTHSDVLIAIQLQRRYNVSWWDAMVLNSAIETGAKILWSEDFSDGQRFGSLTVRNPFGSAVH